MFSLTYHPLVEAPTRVFRDDDHTFALCFGSPDQIRNPQLYERVLSHLPGSTVVGVSTAGQFSGPELSDGPVAVVMSFEHTTVRAVEVAMTSPEASGEAAQQILSHLYSDDLSGVMVFADGTTTNGSELVETLHQQLGRGIELFGGLAGDGDRFEETLISLNGVARPHTVVGVGFYGSAFTMATGSGGGWRPFGPVRRLTSASDVLLTHLDDTTALEVYTSYLGELAEQLPASALRFPLSVWPADETPDAAVVRTILGVDAQAGALSFAGAIPDGWHGRFMHATSDLLVEGAADACDLAVQRLQRTARRLSGTQACLAVSCVGRRLVLGNRVEEELEAVVDELDDDVVFAGFYSYGEIARGPSERCGLHNQTMTLAIVGEHCND